MDMFFRLSLLVQYISLIVYRKIHAIVPMKEPFDVEINYILNVLILYTVETKLDLDLGVQMCVILFISLLTLYFRNK